MHQVMQVTPDKTIIYEKVFFNFEFWVTQFQVAHAVTIDTVPQREILRTGWCTKRVSLHKTQSLDSTGQASGRKQTACNSVATKVVKVYSFNLNFSF
jgi:hypothetical protein